MNREEIVQAVQSYIRNENEKYALLINGASVSKLGIETLAGILYKYIKGNKNNVWTDNDEYRAVWCLLE